MAFRADQFARMAGVLGGPEGQGLRRQAEGELPEIGLPLVSRPGWSLEEIALAVAAAV